MASEWNFFYFFMDISELGCLIHRLKARVLDEAVLTNRNKCSENKIRKKRKTKEARVEKCSLMGCSCYSPCHADVRPSLSGLSGLTSSRPNSSFATSSQVLRAAHQSGVWPYLSGLSGLRYFILNRKLITCSVPPPTASTPKADK